MTSIVLKRRLGFSYKGIVFDKGQVKMVSDDCAKYLLAQRDDQDVPYFQLVEKPVEGTPVGIEQTPEPQDIKGEPTYAELKARATELGLDFKGNASRETLISMITLREMELNDEVYQEATTDPVTITD